MAQDDHVVTKRKPVRRDPEKRRQQNIQAQKKYREYLQRALCVCTRRQWLNQSTGEKLKKRLDDLEILAGSLASQPHPSPIVTSNASLSGAPTPSEDSPANTTSTDSVEQQSPSTVQTPLEHTDHGSIDLLDLVLTPSISPSLNATAPSFDVTLWNPEMSLDPTQFLQGEDNAAEWQKSVVNIDCGCLTTHVQVSASVPPTYTDVKFTTILPNAFAADPYFNALRVERMCIVQAIFANCLHIGISEDMFCDDDAVSPFFRPSSKQADDPGYESVVTSTQKIFTTLKPDIRPIREQITAKHSPVIDVLPFPTLRRNLIKNRDSIDEDELYDDLLNGLKCWGGAGVGKRDRNISTGHISTGSPWDGRSWEARVWFIQKYWAMLGGEDGELVRQSEWWRNIQGDDSSPWAAIWENHATPSTNVSLRPTEMLLLFWPQGPRYPDLLLKCRITIAGNNLSSHVSGI